jgi:hypothetical protein
MMRLRSSMVKAHNPFCDFDFMVSLRGASSKFRLTASGAKWNSSKTGRCALRK